jgi:hypothetical protein
VNSWQPEFDEAPMPNQPSVKALLPAGLILWLALGSLFVSCTTVPPSTRDLLRTGFTELRATAVAVIGDASRRELYLEHCRRLESELLDFETYATGFVEEYRLAFTDYATDQAELELLSEAFRQRQHAMQDRFVELHLAMAGTLTKSEWRPLSKQEARIVESLMKAAPGSDT